MSTTSADLPTAVAASGAPGEKKNFNISKWALDHPALTRYLLVVLMLLGMIGDARADLKKRGIKDAESAPIPAEIFQPQAEKRVRLGLVVAELVRSNNLNAKPEQLQAHIEEMAQSYEKPAEVVRWYLGDRQRMAEVEAVVIENNVAEFVLGRAKVTEKAVAFDELMAG